MIKTAQSKFIRLTALILLGVFIVIFATTFIITRNSTTLSVVDSLDDVVAVYKHDVNAPPPPDALYAEINVNFNTKDVTIITLKYDNSSFKNVDVRAVVKSVGLRSQSITNGNVDSFFYLIDTNQTTYKVFAIDATAKFASHQGTVFKALISLLIIYVALVLITYACSFAVFKPIIENFERQKQFISDASHELKTPLTIISASADVIKAENDSKWVDNIKEQTERMGALVTDMLSLAKLEETATLNKAEFDLSEEVINSTLPFEAITFEHNQRIFYEVQEGIKITADKESVKKIINILMDNAVKYTSVNGKIIIKLSKNKGKTIFSVYNTGSNVPDKDSARIFERFYRADESRSREKGGSGLGLAIAKNIANANKWKIYADSKLGESMTITIVF